MEQFSSASLCSEVVCVEKKLQHVAGSSRVCIHEFVKDSKRTLEVTPDLC